MQKCENLVELEKRCKMSIWSQKSALIKPRTDRLKSKTDTSCVIFESSFSRSTAREVHSADTMAPVVWLRTHRASLAPKEASACDAAKLALPVDVADVDAEEKQFVSKIVE